MAVIDSIVSEAEAQRSVLLQLEQEDARSGGAALDRHMLSCVCVCVCVCVHSTPCCHNCRRNNISFILICRSAPLWRRA